MVALKGGPAIRAEVISDPTVMSGDPVVRGTRVPAETILSYLLIDECLSGALVAVAKAQG